MKVQWYALELYGHNKPLAHDTLQWIACRTKGWLEESNNPFACSSAAAAASRSSESEEFTTCHLSKNE